MPKLARFDKTKPQPAPVEGWLDTDKLQYAEMPDDNSVIVLTDAEWKAHSEAPHTWAVHNGKLVPHERARLTEDEIKEMLIQVENYRKKTRGILD